MMRKVFGCILLFVLLINAAFARLKSEDYIRHYEHLSNTSYCLAKDKKVTIAFLGGSITHMKGWRDLVSEKLKSQYPDVAFTFIDAGIPSLGSLPHAFRFENDVLKKGKVDLLFIESAVNDNVNGTPEKTQRRALEGIVRHALTANPCMDIVLMAFVDQDKMTDYRKGKTPTEVKVHQDIAERYHLPFINLAKEITDRIDRGEFSWEADFKDLHPSSFGQNLYFETIMTLLDDDFKTVKSLKQKSLKSPIDQLNYCRGHYLDVHNTKRLDGFTINEDWSPVDGTPTREGFVHVPVLQASAPGSSFNLQFKGTVIGIGVLSGPNTGTMEYSIDGREYPPIDLFTAWSNTLYLPWFLVLGDDLKSGTHTLQVQISKNHHVNSKGAVLRIVNFLEN